MTGTGAQDRFTAVLLLDELVQPTFEDLQDAAAALHPTMAAEMQHGTTSPLSIILKIGPVAISILKLDRPMEEAVLTRAHAVSEKRWPDVAAAVKGHKTHIAVSSVNVATNHVEALRCASFVTVVGAALCRLCPARAVLWDATDALYPPGVFVDSASRLVQNQLPLNLWLQLIPLEVADPEIQSRQWGLLSDGLRPFLGREIEFALGSTTIEEMSVRVLSLAETLMLNGPVTESGKTFGLSEADRCALNLKDQGMREGIPTFELVAQHLVPPARQ